MRIRLLHKCNLAEMSLFKQDKDSLFLTADTLYSGIRLDTTYVQDFLSIAQTTKARFCKMDINQNIALNVFVINKKEDNQK